MPIFMDRHELAGVSAADIAAAHLKDIDIQDRYGVRFLTYWFDERRGTAFCLMDAPDAETAQCVHREAHGFVASEVVEVACRLWRRFSGEYRTRRRSSLRPNTWTPATVRYFSLTSSVQPK